MYKIDDKLARIRSGDYAKGDFIIADAKDGDMGPSMQSCGPRRRPDGTGWVVLADPAGNHFCIVRGEAERRGAG